MEGAWVIIVDRHQSTKQMGVSKLRGLTTLQPGKEPQYPLNGRLHPRAKFFWVCKEKKKYTAGIWTPIFQPITRSNAWILLTHSRVDEGSFVNTTNEYIPSDSNMNISHSEKHIVL